MTSTYLHEPKVHSRTPFSASRPLVFAINGLRIELSSIDPSMTLLDYLRYHTPFTGTKFGCGEGGCGACVVHLSKYDVHTKHIQEFGINACLALVCSLDGCAITTTEGLGSTKAGFHAVHRRLAGFNGSQCGFCSPGMCMSIYTGLRRSRKEKTPTIQSTSHDIQTALYTLPELKMADAEKMIVGNICRCTGYRPILDACKSFAGDVDMEDLGLNAFWPPGKSADAHLLPPYNPVSDPSFPEFLVEELEGRLLHEQSVRSKRLQAPSLNFSFVDGKPEGGEKFWVTPSALEGVFEALRALKGRGEVKLVVGNTTAGIYKDLKPKVFIDISRIPELLTLRETVHGLEVGAAVALEMLIDHLEAIVALSHGKRTDDHSIFHGILSHLKLVGNPHVRSRASVGGNLIIAQQYSFASDIATLFLGAGVTLQCINSARNQITFTMEEFLQQGSLEPETLLQSIFIPKRQHDLRHNTKLVYKTYRAAPRRFGNALAYINAAFLAELIPASGPTNQKGTHIVKKVTLAFGAFGTKHAIRAKAVEDILEGNLITPILLLTAIHLLKTEAVVPDPGTDNAEYRSSVAVGFLFKFFRPYLTEFSVIPTFNDEVVEELKKTEDNYVTSGKQQFVVSDEFFPVGQPTPKVSAEIQAAGEAIYVDDIPTPDNCLFGAFVYSKMAYAKIQHIDPTSALASVGVISYVSAADIPGQNIGVQTPYGTENLFATELVECFGHPLGIVVADSPQHAKDAAEKVNVQYDSSTVGSPILSIEEAVNRKSFFTIPESIVPQPVGNINTGFAEAEHKIEHAEVRTGGQYFFYMENNTALAVPDEDNCFLLYSSSQGPANLQKCISTCLGLPSNNIRTITRRAGGGFGGKLFRSITVAAACAVAAYKVRRPVRIYLDRNTDAIMMGGRHPVKAVYSVGFKSTGTVTALQINVFIDAGWSPDVSTAIPYYMMKGLKKYNWNALDVQFTVCKTNLASKSAMRAPGVAQGSFIADTVLEHVAASLGLDVHTVYERNIHTLESAATFYSGIDLKGPQGYPLPAMWKEMKNRMSTRADSIQNFNDSSRWLKRGLGISTCTYELETHPQPGRVSILSDGSVVVEVGGVEIGQGLWTKVTLTALFGLHQLWQNDRSTKFPSVRVVQADSISMVNGGFTFESTTSEGSCEAVRKACEMLVERLMPTKMELEKDAPGKVTWLNLITTALTAEIDLSAQIRWPSLEKTWKYLSCGVAAAEVQIDVITGELMILRVDITFDSGKSINPAIDIGQVEGAFMQGVGFLMTEEYEVDNTGKVVSDGTWNYKPPTLDNTPQQFNLELLNGVTNQNRILSSKASGEPPLLMAKCVHTATRQAIESARKDLQKISTSQRNKESEFLVLNAPTTFHKVRELCGFNNVEQYLEFSAHSEKV